MKARKNWFKLTVAITGILLLSIVSGVQAATVVFKTGSTTQAVGILNLELDGTLYNVAFTAPDTTAAQAYGDFPGELPFDTSDPAQDAADAVNDELNSAGALTVGTEESSGAPFYRVAWVSGALGEGEDKIEAVGFWESGKGADPDVDPWLRLDEPDVDSYNFGTRLWANFTVVPIPATAWLLGAGLIGLLGIRRRFKK